jgi:hypothetical protein
LGSKSPLQAMKDWHKLKLQLFRKHPYYLPGCDRCVRLDNQQLPRLRLRERWPVQAKRDSQPRGGAVRETVVPTSGSRPQGNGELK